MPIFFFLVGCRIHSWGILYVLRMLIVLSLACNIAGDSGCFSGYCSQDVGQDRYHIKALSRALEFQDPLRDCWQASVSCQVKIFIWMPTAWPLAPPSEWSKRKNSRQKLQSFNKRRHTITSALCHWCCRPTLCNVGQHKGVNTILEVVCHTNFLSLLCVANIISLFF